MSVQVYTGANVDSLRSVGLIAGALGRADQAGREKRLADAQRGHVTWKTPEDVKRYMALQTSTWKKASPRRRIAREARRRGDRQLLGKVDESSTAVDS